MELESKNYNFYYQTNIFLFKDNNENSVTMREIC